MKTTPFPASLALVLLALLPDDARATARATGGNEPAPAPANDWPQFLGPSRTGKIERADGRFDWGADGPAVLWRTPVGPGYGGVAVHGGEVFLLDREVGELDVLRVFDLETGGAKWDVAYDAPGRLQFPGSRSVPTVTEDFVYTCGGHGHVMGIDREAQVDAWMVNLEETYGGILPDYGWSCSPVLVGDLLVLTALGEDVGLVALDRFTGDEVWVSAPVGITHSTPVVMDLLGEPQIVLVSCHIDEDASLDAPGIMTITSFHPEDGSTLWEAETTGTTYPIPGPVQVSGERFFVTGGYRGGSSMMKLSRTEDGYAAETLFHIERGSQIHNPIVYGESLYLVVNENWNEPRHLRGEGGLLCLGLDGVERWRTGDAPYFGRGNSVLVGDHLLVQDGRTGHLRAVKASPAGYVQVAEANLFGIDDRRDHQMWAPMAVAGERLLLRSQDELLCVEL